MRDFFSGKSKALKEEAERVTAKREEEKPRTEEERFWGFDPGEDDTFAPLEAMKRWKQKGEGRK